METEGFAAEHDFNYELLQIPQEEIKPVQRDAGPLTSPESSVASSESFHPYEYLSPGKEDDVMDENEEKCAVNAEDGDHDMQEARMIETPKFDPGYVTDEGEEGSDGEVDDAAEDDACRAFLTASKALARENPRVKPMSDDLPWPFQMPEEPKGHFKRSGFIYPPPDVNFQPELKYSKRELRKACRDFPLVGWKRWSRQSQSLFLQWMLNEMAATMSLIHKDPIEPMDRLARGYEKWKQQNTENALAEAMRERAATIKILRDLKLLRETKSDL